MTGSTVEPVWPGLASDEHAELSRILAGLRADGYHDVAEHRTLRAGVRIRHVGHQWVGAFEREIQRHLDLVAELRRQVNVRDRQIERYRTRLAGNGVDPLTGLSRTPTTNPTPEGGTS